MRNIDETSGPSVLPFSEETEPEQTLWQAAARIARDLHAVQQILRRPAAAELAGSRLTVPQILVLRALYDTDGLSLKELSARVGLAHSTLSGIVERLERRGLVERRTRPEDRRITGVFLSQRVRDRFFTHWRSAHLVPVVAALRAATEEQQAQIAGGLATLRGLLERAGSNDE
jgi:MarR family transcriptional regulator, organic hydroperoxide resistance regulator